MSTGCQNVRQKLGTRQTLSLSLSLSHSLTLDMQNNFCFHVYAQKSLFIFENAMCFFKSSSLAPMPVTVHRAGSQLKSQTSAGNLSSVKFVKCPKCLCWSLGHAEQLLCSCLCSKVTYMSNVKCQKLMLIIGTCWTTFVFMSMLKSLKFKGKNGIAFFGTLSSSTLSPVTLEFIMLVPS